MSILRVKKEEKYAVISNEPLNNKSLTWEARGVMAYLLSKPDGWECRNYDLVNQGPASEHIIRRVLKELQEAGYIYRYRKSEGRGKIEWVTEIYETPELNTAFRNGTFSSLDNIDTESFNLEKSVHIVSTDSLVNTDKLESTDLNGTAKTSKLQNPVTPVVEAIRDNDQTKREYLNGLADQVATICKIDIDMASPKTREALKAITVSLHAKHVSEADLSDFGIWWYDNTWQGKKGQPPTPTLIGDSWGQFEAQKVINVPITTNGGFYV